MDKGDKVTVVTETPIEISEETLVVERLSTEEIYLEGQQRPFDNKTGKMICAVPGFVSYIKEVKE